MKLGSPITLAQLRTQTTITIATIQRTTYTFQHYDSYFFNILLGTPSNCTMEFIDFTTPYG